MDKKIYGQGHSRVITDDLIAERISHEVYAKNTDHTITPNIALASADFEGNLVCGRTVKWIRTSYDDPYLLQDTQGNEDPEVSEFQLCYDEAEICGSKALKYKLSVDQLRDLMCEGLDSIYFEALEKRISTSIELLWEDSHFAHMLMMACAENTGNNAQDMIDLGSPDKPIVIPKDPAARSDTLFEIYQNLHLILSQQNVMNNDGDTALIMPTIVANRSINIFTDLNQCCSDDNIKISGNLPTTMLGFDPFKSNRDVLWTMHNGRRIYYIIAADKYASGFVSEMYNFKWWEGQFDWYLVGNEAHGSYVVQPEHIAVACVTFE